MDSRSALERMADEVQAEHESKLKRKRRRQKFAGLNSAQSRHRSKYEDAEYTYDGSRRIRRLTVDEVSAFRVHIQRLIDPDSVTVLVPVRRAVV